MIESGGQLATWRLASAWFDQATQPAERIAPHRVDFLDSEGELSGNRGTVHRVDQGMIEIAHWTDNRIEGKLFGLRGSASVSLVLVPESGTWQLDVVALGRANTDDRN
jgi:hypothetical protein